MSVVSSVLSRVSTRSRPTIGWNVNVSFSSLMDSLFSIAFGLGLRFVVDTVSHQDFKLTGTLVGLWEGVILLHFTKKVPKSSDPYIAFAVRLCVDFFLTESVARLVLVLIWTGLGMILADITPAIWSDVGLNRVWRRLRRDLYTIGQMVPTVAFFPPQRTVRFSPSHAASVIGDDDAASDITATEQTPSAPVPPPNPILPPSRDARKRRVPGHYGFEYSDTETERSYAPTPVQPRAGPSTRTSRRLSVYPGQQSASDSMSSLTPDDDIDAGNLSDGASSSGGTERAGPSTTSIINMSEVQGASSSDAAAAPATVAVAPTLDTAAAATATKDDEAGNRTPTQQPLWIPPTPSDSAAAWRLSRAREAGNFDEAIKPMRPLGLGLGLGLAGSGEKMPQIPDFLDEPLTEDWTDLGKPTTADVEPTTTTTTTQPISTTADDPFASTTPAEHPSDPTAAAPDALESNTLLEPPAYEAWPSGSGAGTAEREYKTAEDFDDIYGEEAPAAGDAALDAEKQTADLLGGVEGLGEGAGAGEADSAPTAGNNDDPAPTNDLVPTDLTEAADAAIDPEAQAIILEIAKLEQEDEAKRLAEEADAEADRMLKDAEVEAEAKMIADAAEAKALEEAEREKEAEAKRLEESLAEEEKRLADALAEAKRLEDEAKRLADEAVAAAAADAEAAAKKEEKKKKKKTKKDADERKAKEEADEAARQAKRAEEEAKQMEEERKAKEEEEKKEAEAKEQKRKDAEAAAERRAQKLREKEEKEATEKEKERIAKEEEEKAEAERKAQQEEAERKAKEEQEEADRKAKEEEEQRLKEEAEAKEREEKEKEEAERLQREEEEKKALDEWTTLDKANDAEADAIAAAALESALAQEQGAPGQEAAEGELPVSTGFSPEPLVNLDDAEPESEQQPAPTTVPAYEESVVSDATVGMPPQDPRERLERSMVLRAQMVEIQNQIDDLKAGGAGEDSPQLKQLEKIMRKMVRQATRRYAAGIECAQYLNGFDDSSDVVSLENVHPGAVMKKIAEQIEYLLSPSAKSLSFCIQVAKKAVDAKKQKPKVVSLIEEFNLTNYTIENAVNKKISEITISEEDFGAWVTGYRNLLTRRAKEEDESPWG